VKRTGVGTIAGANRLERHCVDAAFPQVTRQQRGQHGFANAGVRAGDEERHSLHSGNIKAEMSWVSHQNH
jgi:hypothetical protein